MFEFRFCPGSPALSPHTLPPPSPPPPLPKLSQMAVFAEHIILGIKASVRVLIDDMPDGVEKAMAEELLHVHEESRRRVEGMFRLGEDVKCEK